MVFFLRITKKYVCINYLDDFLGMCDRLGVEPDDILEANYQNYFAIGVVENKENVENCPSTTAADEFFDVRAITAYGGRDN